MTKDTERPPLLEIDDATVFRGTHRVLERFSLSIDQGEHVAILGPNGAGKTTLIKLLNRELYPRADTATRCRILGRESWNVWDLRRQIGFVSAELQHRYHASIPVRDVVVSGFLSSIGVHGTAAASIRTQHRDRAARVIDDLGLPDLADRRYGELSTGQQRLVLLARALVHEPTTLVLDEPSAGLDFGAASDVMQRIRHLAAAGVSLVIVTHHLDEIPPEIERVILLKDGRITADGPPAAVLTDALLSAAYGVDIAVFFNNNRYFAAPAW
jgi:iron complex transport system ATP-binding protein